MAIRWAEEHSRTGSRGIGRPAGGWMTVLSMLLAIIVLTACVAPAPASSRQMPSATASGGIPQVGALFLGGFAGSGSAHSCTASVLRAADRDVVLTAAHCVSGDGSGVQFVPGYHDGMAPYGVWTVQAAYADPRWVSGQDPQHDYTFLLVADQQRGGQTVRLADVVSGNSLGLAPVLGHRVQVIAYPDDRDQPISCTAATYVVAGYPAFDCQGFGDGTSGAPSLDPSAAGGTTVRGLIGGLHQGGCSSDTSYSPRFDQDTLAVYQRAARADSPDTLPVAGDDAC